MTPREVRLISNTRQVFQRMTFTDLFHVVHSISAELERRGSSAHVEALALQAALLVEAHAESARLTEAS